MRSTIYIVLFFLSGFLQAQTTPFVQYSPNQLKQRIERLSLIDRPSKAQRHWITQQTTNPVKRYARINEGEHSSPMVILNISAMAKEVLARWNSIDLALRLSEQLKLDRIEWHKLAHNLNLSPRPALSLNYLLNSLTQPQLNQLAAKILTLNHQQTSPLLLAKLALFEHQGQKLTTKHSKQLLQRLWQHNADEHSISALAQLKASYQQFKHAAANPALSSLSLNLIAKHHDSHK